MANNYHENDEHEFDESKEDLSLENELLKIKMQIESGGKFESKEELTPEMENHFLKNVELFQENFKNPRMDTVYNIVGKPDFIPADKLTFYEFYAELPKLKKLMRQRNVDLLVKGDYDADIIYRFITEELFAHETVVIAQPNIVTQFIYEEFHPSLEVELQEAAELFLKQWFERHIDEDFPIINVLTTIHPGITFSREEALQKVQNFFDCFCEFYQTDRGMDRVEFQWNEESGAELGCVEGSIYYKGKLESGEEVVLDGPFGVYFVRFQDTWCLYSFNISGFTWI